MVYIERQTDSKQVMSSLLVLVLERKLLENPFALLNARCENVVGIKSRARSLTGRCKRYIKICSIKPSPHIVIHAMSRVSQDDLLYIIGKNKDVFRDVIGTCEECHRMLNNRCSECGVPVCMANGCTGTEKGVLYRGRWNCVDCPHKYSSPGLLRSLVAYGALDVALTGF